MDFHFCAYDFQAIVLKSLGKLIQLVVSVFFVGDVGAIWPLNMQFLPIFLIKNLIVVFSLNLLVNEEDMNIVVINLI